MEKQEILNLLFLVLGVVAIILGLTATAYDANALVTLSRIQSPEFVTLSQSGNVGVGDTAPLCLLSVGGGSIADSTVPVQISSGFYGINRDDGYYGLTVGYSSNYSGCTLLAHTWHAVFQVSNSINALFVGATGRTGVGTTNPMSVFDVNGLARVQKDFTVNGVARTSETISGAGALSTTLDSIVDSRSASFTVTLGAGSSDQVKGIRLQTGSALPVTVTCANTGSFLLTPSDPSRTLRYLANMWTTEYGNNTWL